MWVRKGIWLGCCKVCSVTHRVRGLPVVGRRHHVLRSDHDSGLNCGHCPLARQLLLLALLLLLLLNCSCGGMLHCWGARPHIDYLYSCRQHIGAGGRALRGRDRYSALVECLGHSPRPKTRRRGGGYSSSAQRRRHGLVQLGRRIWVRRWTEVKLSTVRRGIGGRGLKVLGGVVIIIIATQDRIRWHLRALRSTI